MPKHSDDFYMKNALSLAYQNLGQVYPNPSVGCLIVDLKSGEILSRAATQKGGRPHAESIALNKFEKIIHERKIDTLDHIVMYVTLEPCVHHGKTPPCTEHIINSGIKKIFVAVKDIDPRVNGKGIEKLKKAGIEVIYGICEEDANGLNKGFNKRIDQNKPYLALKIVSTADGKIATSTGESQWISNGLSRLYAHKLRSKYDAIMVGSETVLKDNPQLNCRLKGLEDHSPIKVILDRRGRLTGKLNIFDGNVPVYIFTTRPEAFVHLGSHVSVFEYMSLEVVLKSLAEYGITRVLCEGGASLITSFIQEDLYDKIIWIRSPDLIGKEGFSAVKDLGIEKIEKKLTLKKQTSFSLIKDDITLFEK